MSARMNHWYSDEWCRDEKATTQDKLQNIAKAIRANSKVAEIANAGENGRTCTIYENEALGLKYWVHDTFGHISTIDEARTF